MNSVFAGLLAQFSCERSGQVESDMVRLSDLHPDEAKHIISATASMAQVEPGPWLSPKPLSESTVAIISTAGLHRRNDRPFTPGTGSYRLLPGDVDFGDMVLSHVSSNFDRSAFQRDPNVFFPLDRLREMAAENEIGEVAQWHYSFMGALPDPTRLQATGEEVGRLLAADDVDVALLVPV